MTAPGNPDHSIVPANPGTDSESREPGPPESSVARLTDTGPAQTTDDAPDSTNAVQAETKSAPGSPGTDTDGRNTALGGSPDADPAESVVTLDHIDDVEPDSVAPGNPKTISEPPPLPPLTRRKRRDIDDLVDRRPRHRRPKPPSRPADPRDVRHKWWIRRVIYAFRNDMIGWEVMRSGRRVGTQALSRTVLGGIILAAMWALWSASFQDGTQFTGEASAIGRELNKFAGEFAMTFFMVQYLGIMLLTPVFTAGAIFEERDTRSGEVLLTTELTRREVYVGKIGARILQMILITVAGLPILALTQLWGGIDIETIVIGYLMAVVLTITTGTVTVAVSADAETMRGALFRAYLWLFVINIMILPSPFLVAAVMQESWITAGVMLFFSSICHFVITWIAYTYGQRWLRLAMLRQRRRFQLRAGQLPHLPHHAGRRLPPIEGNPLYWRELHRDGRMTFRRAVRAFFNLNLKATIDDRWPEMGGWKWFTSSQETGAMVMRAIAFGIFVFFFVLIVSGSISGAWVLLIVGSGLFLWLISAIGLTAASSVAWERQKHTLIDLLMIPGQRQQLLTAKLYGSLVRGIWPLVWMTILAFTATVSGQIHFLSGIAVLVSAAIFGVFCGLLGMWLSVRQRTQIRSTSTWLGIMAAVIVAGFVLAEADKDWKSISREYPEPYQFYPTWSRIANPMLSWTGLNFDIDSDTGLIVTSTPLEEFRPHRTQDVLASAISPLLFLLVGWVLWWHARNQFEQDGRF